MTRHATSTKASSWPAARARALHPVTRAVSKQLLPVYDKPMIYYPLSTLMLAGIRDILVISTPEDVASFRATAGRRQPDRHLDSLRRAAAARGPGPGLHRSAASSSARIAWRWCLGDNIFFGQGFQDILARAARRESGATIFAYAVKDPERYGVVELDAAGPADLDRRKARRAQVEARRDRPVLLRQRRGRHRGQSAPFGARRVGDHRRESRVPAAAAGLHVEVFTRGFAWLDTGTHESLIQAANFVQTIEMRQGLKIACIEEVAYHKGFITAEQLEKLARRRPNDYGQYLLQVLEQPPQAAVRTRSRSEAARSRCA